jgi:ubiquinone biosynthesis monooxygenase Coq7
MTDTIEERTPAARPLPPRPGPGAVGRRLAEMLRVDHAGELAAAAIYRGQRAVLRESPGAGRTLAQIADLEAQEDQHLARFDALLIERGVRPSALAPLWRAAGFGLGAATALIGETAAHACTEAVETVIEGHYAAQIAELDEPEPELAAELCRFRDDEMAHRDLALAEGARNAPAYPLLSAVIRAGCRAAIRLAEKV